MSTTSGKKNATGSTSVAKPVARQKARPVNEKPARASQLRAQTRKLLGKHYRAKYGVR